MSKFGRRPAIASAVKRPSLGPIVRPRCWEPNAKWMAGAPAIHFAFGSQHLGLTMGPKLGRLTADAIAGRRPNFDMRPYRVDRFNRR